jgi:hypothetical protein
MRRFIRELFDARILPEELQAMIKNGDKLLQGHNSRLDGTCSPAFGTIIWPAACLKRRKKSSPNKGLRP